MFVNTRKSPTCFGPFHSTILRGPYAAPCAITIMSSADLHSLSICLVCGCMCISVEGMFVNSQTDLPLTRALSTHTNR